MNNLPLADPHAEETVPLKAAGAWQYECLPRSAKCKIDGSDLSLSLRLEKFLTSSAPDVLAIERWFAELVKHPVTVEDVAVAARERWGMTATVRGSTGTHGPLQFRVPH